MGVGLVHLLWGLDTQSNVCFAWLFSRIAQDPGYVVSGEAHLSPVCSRLSRPMERSHRCHDAPASKAMIDGHLTPLWLHGNRDTLSVRRALPDRWRVWWGSSSDNGKSNRTHSIEHSRMSSCSWSRTVRDIRHRYKTMYSILFISSTQHPTPPGSALLLFFPRRYDL